MKTVNIFLISLFFISSFASCHAQTSEKKNQTKVSENNIAVYYFHYTRRCATCNAVEDESKKALETLYAEKVNAGTITFQSINLDDDSSKEIADKLNVSGQSLLIVKGNEKIDLTNDGFMFARSNPEKLKAKIKAEMDKLL